jgi:hypothetical protein
LEVIDNDIFDTGSRTIFPEPHIVGKIRWIMGGANGMDLMDWVDFLMHAAP